MQKRARIGAGYAAETTRVSQGASARGQPQKAAESRRGELG